MSSEQEAQDLAEALQHIEDTLNMIDGVDFIVEVTLDHVLKEVDLTFYEVQSFPILEISIGLNGADLAFRDLSFHEVAQILSNVHSLESYIRNTILEYTD